MKRKSPALSTTAAAAALCLLASAAYAANLGVAAYGLPRWENSSVTNLRDALVASCKDSKGAFVANCRVEFSWLITFSDLPRIETTNAEWLAAQLVSSLPTNARITVTTALGFHSNEQFACADLTSSARNTAGKLDNDKAATLSSGARITIPSYKKRLLAVTAMIDSIYKTTAVDRRAMLQFVIIPHLEDACSAAQYGYLRDWIDGIVPPYFAHAAAKPPIHYRRSPNGDWPKHHTAGTKSPRVSGNALELHGALGDYAYDKVTVASLLNSGDTYTPDGTCIDWTSSSTIKALRSEYSSGVSILYWIPQFNGRSSCGGPAALPQFDPARDAGGFSYANAAAFQSLVQSVAR